MPAEITHPTDEFVSVVCTDCFWSTGPIPLNLEDHALSAVDVHNAVMHPVETGAEAPASLREKDAMRLRVIFTAANRWQPPNAERQTMNVHADVRKRLRAFCNETMKGTGVGYSEFIMAALDAHERGAWSISDVPSPASADEMAGS